MWPFRRREHAEAPPADAVEVLRPARTEWRTLAPMPVVQASPLGTLDRSFEDSLVTRGRPLFLGALSHHVHHDAPAGTVQGLARPAATAGSRDLAPATPVPAQRIAAAPEAAGPSSSAVAPEPEPEPEPEAEGEVPVAAEPPPATTVQAMPVSPSLSGSVAPPPPTATSRAARSVETSPGERPVAIPAALPVVQPLSVAPSLTRAAPPSPDVPAVRRAPTVSSPSTVQRAVAEPGPVAPTTRPPQPTANAPASVDAVADEQVEPVAPVEQVDVVEPAPTVHTGTPAEDVTDRPVLAQRTPLAAEPGPSVPPTPAASPSSWRIGEPLAPVDRPSSDTGRSSAARPTRAPRLGAPLQRTADSGVDPVPPDVVPESAPQPDAMPVDVAPLLGDTPALAAGAGDPRIGPATDPLAPDTVHAPDTVRAPDAPRTAIAAPVQRATVERSEPVADEPAERPVLGIAPPILGAPPSSAAGVTAADAAPLARSDDVALVGARDVAMTVTPAAPAAAPSVQRAVAPVAAAAAAAAPTANVRRLPPVLRAGPVPPSSSPTRPPVPGTAPVVRSAATTRTWTTPAIAVPSAPDPHIDHHHDSDVTTTITIQRAADDPTASDDGDAIAPSAQPSSTTEAGPSATTTTTAAGATATSGGAVAAGGRSEAEILELARVLYPQLQRRLARDLLVDRERAGYRTDIRF